MLPDEIYTPIMHRDVMGSMFGMPMYDPDLMGMGSVATNGMGGAGMMPMMGMGMMPMMGGFNTNYLGGVSLKPNLSNDTVTIMHAKEREAESNMKTIGGLALAAITITSLIGLFKGKKTPWIDSIKSFFGKKTTTPAPATTSTGRVWYNPMTWFGKKTSTTTP